MPYHSRFATFPIRPLLAYYEHHVFEVQQRGPYERGAEGTFAGANQDFNLIGRSSEFVYKGEVKSTGAVAEKLEGSPSWRPAKTVHKHPPGFGPIAELANAVQFVGAICVSIPK